MTTPAIFFFRYAMQTDGLAVGPAIPIQRDPRRFGATGIARNDEVTDVPGFVANNDGSCVAWTLDPLRERATTPLPKADRERVSLAGSRIITVAGWDSQRSDPAFILPEPSETALAEVIVDVAFSTISHSPGVQNAIAAVILASVEFPEMFERSVLDATLVPSWAGFAVRDVIPVVIVEKSVFGVLELVEQRGDRQFRAALYLVKPVSLDKGDVLVSRVCLQHTHLQGQFEGVFGSIVAVNSCSAS